ncbi:MAG: calcium-binding protein, partial [Moraxellaceae bacterium]
LAILFQQEHCKYAQLQRVRFSYFCYLIIQYVTNKVTFEGGVVSFVVQASDPNNTVPTLTVPGLPTGASFTPSAANTGVFSWSPTLGQAGSYPIKVMATDGALTSERTLMIKVNTAADSDGDGLSDDWERQHFGDLSHDGTTDSDGDGRTDAEEFADQSDPNAAEAAPATPQILTPIFNADTLQGVALPLLPVLTVTNGTHTAGVGSVAVVFEIYKDAGLTQLMAKATINEGAATTQWSVAANQLTNGNVFEDNRLYYWRAKAQQQAHGTVSSAWVKSQFFINRANDAPSAPQISFPAVAAIVPVVSPTLVVTNAQDPDRDELRYSFALFKDTDLTTAIATVEGLLPGANGQTSWPVPKVLLAATEYTWQVVATDIHGAQTPSTWGSFTINTQNQAPTIPQIVAPVAAAQVPSLLANNSLALTINNSV